MAIEIDKDIIISVIYSFSGVIVAALMAFSVIGGIAFSKIQKGGGKSFGLLFTRGNFLRIFTVVFCIYAVVILSCTGCLTEGSIAVLSGVAGFVLGGSSKAEDKQHTESESK